MASAGSHAGPATAAGGAPTKLINDRADLAAFAASRARARLVRVLAVLSQLVAGRAVPPAPTSAAARAVVRALAALGAHVDAVPPDTGRQRFGNTAFRMWAAGALGSAGVADTGQAAVAPTAAGAAAGAAATAAGAPPAEPASAGAAQAAGPALGLEALHELAPTHAAWAELDHYLAQAFGSAQRLDYGTGHELNFIAFVGGLWGLGLPDGTPAAAVGAPVSEPLSGSDALAVFAAYYAVAQKVIRTYNLEPAGSHGVWGLDDHFHAIYILGSAQLVEGADVPVADNGAERAAQALRPKDVLDPQAAAAHAGTNLYFNAIHFIYTMKRGNFFEHSSMLYDISAVATWTKIHRGLVKMYLDEVIGRFPVVQHLWLGRLYTLEPEPAASSTPGGGTGGQRGPTSRPLPAKAHGDAPGGGPR